jgi:hypothetical protein
MKNAEPTQFDELNTVLATFTRGIQMTLGENFVALYLQGSFAIGDADAYSDVDFTAVIQNDLTDEELRAVTAMHNRIYEMDTEWAKHLEGSYFPRDYLQDHTTIGKQLWYLDNGARKFRRDAHDNTFVVRWTTREKGILLAGDNPRQLIAPIPTAALNAEVRQTMIDWGKEILSGKYDIGNRWAQPFATLLYCRMLQTLATGAIYSKKVAVEWGIANLDNEWDDLIQHAWAQRSSPDRMWYNTDVDPALVQRTQAFIRYAIELATSLGQSPMN